MVAAIESFPKSRQIFACAVLLFVPCCKINATLIGALPNFMEKEKEIVAAAKKTKKKTHALVEEFKAFINRGSVVDLAIGVIIGGAFGTIVSSVVNVLLTLCTWGIPGGISGLVTVLPALNSSQQVPAGLGLSNIIDVATYAGLSSSYQSLYVKHGGMYYYNALPILDWGAVLTAVIDFLIIALVLFTILKVMTIARKRKEAFVNAQLEEYYKRHPEDRPAAVVPGAPVLTQMEVLLQIRDELRKQNKATVSAPEAAEKK
jgi:large conductance mechanosensitive channel